MGIKKYFFILFLFIFFLFNPAYCSEIRDMSGRKLKVPDNIKKVYCASPPVTWLVYCLAPDLLCGLNYPVNKKERKYFKKDILNLPILGGGFGQGRTPNIEAIMKAKPDIVLMWRWNREALNKKMMKSLKPLNCPVIYITMDSVFNYEEVFRFTGRLLKREKRGELLAEYTKKSLDEINKYSALIPENKRPRVYYAEDYNGLSTDCTGSLHTELIPLCKGKNVHECRSKTPYGRQKISMEQVLIYNPDAVLAEKKAFFESSLKNPVWKGLKAYKNNKVFLIPDLPLNWFDRPPSFMRILGAKWLLSNLYPDLYKIDIREETKNFYRLFLHFEPDDKALKDIGL